MQVKKILCLLFLLTAVSTSSIGLAGDNETENPDLQELRQQILELKRQMNEMKQKHESEIKSLKEEISKLSKPTAEEVEVEDEVALLRELAESMAGEKKEQKKPEETVYKFGGLSLQQLNPQISVSGDFVGHYAVLAKAIGGERIAATFSKFRLIHTVSKADI